MTVPDPVRLFHITSMANLPAIASAGALSAKNALAQNGQHYKNIAYQGAQCKRSRKTLPIPPGGVIHDYVPFYFAPRSPMLMAIDAGKVPDCPDGQADIVHLETTVAAVVETGQPFIFFDRNATLDYSEPYTDLSHLSEVAWELLMDSPRLDGFCKYFNSTADGRYADRKERRMAEFLIRDRVPLACMLRIGVIDVQRQEEARAIVATAGLKLPVDVKTDWYFLGQ